MASIFINIAIVFFFLFVAKRAYETDPQTILGALYDPKIGVGYFILGNLVGSAASLVFLYPELKQIRFVFDKKLWKEVIVYSYPLLIVGFGGMINELLSRVIYRKVAEGTSLQQDRALGIFGANYKLAVLITIFIQIFRLAAEPFFFNQSAREDAKKIYARVMKFFVIACCFMFLIIALFLDFWQLLIASGDVLFSSGIGRTDLPGGDYDKLMDSIRNKLFTLPDEVVVYSGHGPETTIGQEKRSNPFLV